MPERAHRGRRQDRTSTLRLSRQEREDGLLDLLGVFRVAARRSIVNAVFDGHPFAANRTLASLERRGLIDKKTVPRGKTGYQVYMLTGRGRDSKSAIAGLIFGAGMVLASVQFLNWLNFGGGTVGKCA